MLVARSCGALHVRSIATRALIQCRSYAKDYASSSDDEKEIKKKPKQPKTNDDIKQTEAEKPDESAANRLNRLLASMQTDSYTFEQKINMAKPGEAHKKVKQQAKAQAANRDVFEAVKRVASLLGEDKKQTESELLSKLLGHKQEETTATGAETDNKAAGNEQELSLSELIVGMKIDRTPQPKTQDTRADFVRRAIAAKTQYKPAGERKHSSRSHQEFKRAPETYTGSVNLFSSERLGIFKAGTQLKQSADILPTWSYLQQRELQLQVAHPAANYFEKLAMWTEQGKVWRFPIDNEQDIAEHEVNEDFSEHIFLEQHLENWCPNKGPIRHFMELVCVGLSKNPYITAKEKKEHILWYRDYFQSKKDILGELMSQEKMEQLAASKQKAEQS